MMETKIIVTEEYSGERIDKFLTSQLTDVSRNNIINLIEEGFIKLNGKTTKPSNKLKENDEIIVEQKENIDLDAQKFKSIIDLTNADFSYDVEVYADNGYYKSLPIGEIETDSKGKHIVRIGHRVQELTQEL